MTFPETVEPDADSESQIAWPIRPSERGRRASHKSQRSEVETGSVRGGSSSVGRGKATDASASGKKRMSTLDLIYLSVSMAGSQVAWTVELG